MKKVSRLKFLRNYFPTTMAALFIAPSQGCNGKRSGGSASQDPETPDRSNEKPFELLKGLQENARSFEEAADANKADFTGGLMEIKSQVDKHLDPLDRFDIIPTLLRPVRVGKMAMVKDVIGNLGIDVDDLALQNAIDAYKRKINDQGGKLSLKPRIIDCIRKI